MSGFNAPLSVQAASLKKSVQNRERRRNARQAGSAWEAADVESKALLKSGSAGIALTPESAVYDHAPQVFHCSLCQAAFPNAGLHRQHLDSAAHKKALAKQERDREQAERLSRGRDAAENAVAAAQWASGGFAGAQAGRARTAHQSPAMQPGRGAVSGSPHAQQQPGRGRGRGRGRFGAEQPSPPAAPKQSHADMVAALKQQQEPLTIGGWAPPTISTSAAPHTAEQGAGPAKLAEAVDSSGGVENAADQNAASAGTSEEENGDAAQLQPKLPAEVSHQKEGLGGLADYGSGDSGSDEDSGQGTEEGNASRPLGPFF